MTTSAEQEAERRYPVVTYDLPPYADMFSTMARRHFVEGVEWSESRYRELLEAAREYREALMVNMLGPQAGNRRGEAANRLLAAAAALEE